MLRAMLTTVTAFLFLLAATAADAETGDAGSVVSLEGTVDIGRAGTFSPAEVGSAIRQGDTIRTGTPGRARLLFVDDSVINIGDGSTLVIDETVFNAGTGAASTLMHLLGGKVRALVSDYYSGGQGSYQIETKTAVSGVRGTEFIMAYDSRTQLSEVLGSAEPSRSTARSTARATACSSTAWRSPRSRRDDSRRRRDASTKTTNATGSSPRGSTCRAAACRRPSCSASPRSATRSFRRPIPAKARVRLPRPAERPGSSRLPTFRRKSRQRPAETFSISRSRSSTRQPRSTSTSDA